MVSLLLEGVVSTEDQLGSVIISLSALLVNSAILVSRALMVSGDRDTNPLSVDVPDNRTSWCGSPWSDCSPRGEKIGKLKEVLALASKVYNIPSIISSKFS